MTPPPSLIRGQYSAQTEFLHHCDFRRTRASPGSFHNKSTKKSDFWTGPFPIFFKFGTHYYTNEKLPKPKFWIKLTQFEAATGLQILKF